MGTKSSWWRDWSKSFSHNSARVDFHCTIISHRGCRVDGKFLSVHDSRLIFSGKFIVSATRHCRSFMALSAIYIRFMLFAQFHFSLLRVFTSTPPIRMIQWSLNDLNSFLIHDLQWVGGFEGGGEEFSTRKLILNYVREFSESDVRPAQLGEMISGRRSEKFKISISLQYEIKAVGGARDNYSKTK